MTDTGYDPAAAVTEAIKTMSPDQAVKMVRELCSQLGNDAETFHGNIWPDNIRLDWEGKAILGEPSDEPPNRREAEQVEYLSPEYFWDSEGSASADVYSLGMLLYAACSGGYLPFQPRDGELTPKGRSGALRKRMKGEPIEPPTGVTPMLAEVIRKALSYEPEDRFISAEEFLRALSETDEALPLSEVPVAAEQDGEPAEESFAAEEPCEPEQTEESGLSEAGAESAPLTEEDSEQWEMPPEPNEDGEAELAPDTKREEEPVLDELIEAELAFLDLPNAEDDTAEPPKQEAQTGPVYTVQKDFESDSSEPMAVPEANRKKKPSPLIPVLCIGAVVILAVSAVLLQGRHRNTEVAVSVNVPYTIEPTQSASVSEAAVVTPSLGDDEPADAGTESDAESVEQAQEAEEETDSEQVEGDTIDGMTVEPMDDYVRISDTGANLRTGPGTNYAVAASLPRGTELVRTGVVNGWSQVQYSGIEYYVASNLVVQVEHIEPEAVGETEVVGSVLVTADVNIRSGPGTDYDKVGEAKKGAMLNALGRSSDGKWYLISYNGVEGYVNRNFVRVQAYAEVTEQTGVLSITREVNIRSGPGTGYEILGVGHAGDTFTLTGVSDTGWYRIRFSGATAFLAADYAEIR